MSTRFAIRGATALTPQGPLANALAVIEDGRIASLGPDEEGTIGDDVHAVEATGLLLSPGLIDIQLNGGFGHDFTARPATMWQLGEQLARQGVTAFLATIVSAPPPSIEQALAAFAGGPSPAVRGAVPLGLHLEGPFLNVTAAGAHQPAHLRPPDRALAADWSSANGVRIVTLAPELDGALELVERLAASGVVVAAGHSTASYDQGIAAIDAGVRYATHLLNAMPPIDRRLPGLAAALLADERVTVGIIPDGVHLHPGIVRLIDRACGPGRLSAVTDATAALGMPDGEYALAGARVTLDGPAVRLPDGRLAGSALAADETVRRLAAITGRSAADALAAMTSVPARLLGDESRGSLVLGARADLVLWTPRLEVVATWVAGEEAYSAWH